MDAIGPAPTDASALLVSRCALVRMKIRNVLQLMEDALVRQDGQGRIVMKNALKVFGVQIVQKFAFVLTGSAIEFQDNVELVLLAISVLIVSSDAHRIFGEVAVHRYGSFFESDNKFLTDMHSYGSRCWSMQTS